MSELKACPFCGGRASRRYHPHGAHTIECNGCHVSTCITGGTDQSEKDWNNRKPEAATNKPTLDEAIEQRITDCKRDAAEEMYDLLESIMRDDVRAYGYEYRIGNLLAKARGE